MVNAWNEPMNDVGPAGLDQGKGAKYLLLPPDFNAEIPAGYVHVKYPTYNGYALYRAIRNSPSETDVAAALALVKKIRVYPLAQAANPPEQRYIDIYGKTFDGIADFDERFLRGSTAWSRKNRCCHAIQSRWACSRVSAFRRAMHADPR
jgi:hypothetical protein